MGVIPNFKKEWGGFVVYPIYSEILKKNFKKILFLKKIILYLYMKYRYIENILMVDSIEVDKETFNWLEKNYNFNNIKEEKIKDLIRSNNSENIELAIQILKTLDNVDK